MEIMKITQLREIIREEIKSINEKVASPFSYHIRKEQDEIEYMIDEHTEAEDEGVYTKPREAIKLLTVAQKALGKIK